MAAAHLLFGQHSKAMALLELVQWLEPECPRTLELIAYCAFYSKNFERGIRAIEQLKEQNTLVAEGLRIRYRIAENSPLMNHPNFIGSS
ncbi:hypothetical protein [uncultured Tateyamaria sp.]|uniref:hypothetical protein n=1 Tax=uncultured Tateyamaria sp. TaxID=455651 RepID=UPI0026249DB5|nr:hypothetical protein [uncultured Tateyamaria sp.]